MAKIDLKFRRFSAAKRNPKSKIRNGNTGFIRSARSGLIRTGRTGFTMMELMLTIGIMAVAITMVASIFPVAILESNQSYKDIVGTLVCENGLAVTKAVLVETDVPSNMGVIFDEANGTSILGKNFQHYKSQFEEVGTVWINRGFRDDDLDTDEKMRGFLVLGKKLSSSTDINQLIVVSYARSGDTTGNNEVTAELVGCTVAAGETKIENGGGELRVGSPLIDAVHGYYATIITTNSDQTEGELDRPIYPTGGNNVNSAFVIQETNEDKKSPTLSVLVTLTGLE
ncbi:MAG: prepilin-type N-terminal cleavage/methylation domain-containing protein [Phycisphaerae bacterium]|nr:prepilin-type N-terminal cleavage/methylation domain-containing protein [Phycisphaerae bacterium]